MKRYAGQNEVRFKVTDKQKEIYDETASYLYENNVIDKSNIQSFGRWSMDFVCKNYRLSVLQSKIIKQRQERQKQMQEPAVLSYPPYYTSDLTQPF